jgi:hypothetical protein
MLRVMFRVNVLCLYIKVALRYTSLISNVLYKVAYMIDYHVVLLYYTITINSYVLLIRSAIVNPMTDGSVQFLFSSSTLLPREVFPLYSDLFWYDVHSLPF